MPEGYLRSFASGKFAWGSATLRNITGDAKAAEVARRIANYLVETQEKDRHWPATRLHCWWHAPQGSKYKYVYEINLTAEFVTWLSEILMNIA